MLKLMRNTLGDGGILVDADGQKIRWQYLVELNKLQQEEGLHLANKLSSVHVGWQAQNMKVYIAAQTLSSSVATAIEFCRVNLKLPQFEGSKATVRFLRLIDHLFDVLNSRNPIAKGYKAPLRKSNYPYWGPFLDEASNYIKNLRDTAGQLMTGSRRKTSFIGFLCTIESIKALYFQLVDTPSAPLKYLLTYKLSQDHLELFFSAVRSSLGSNNNPTARQFMAAYKRLLIRNEIRGVGGNCIDIDKTSILFVTGNAVKVNGVQTDTLNISILRRNEGTADDAEQNDVAVVLNRYDIVERHPMQADHDYVDVSNSCFLSEYKEYVVGYIAGFVVRMVRKIIKCPDCLGSLSISSEMTSKTNLFLQMKDKGGLVKPSQSVVAVCKCTERCLQRMLLCCRGKLPHATSLLSAISMTVLGEIGETAAFDELKPHMFDCTPDSNHIFVLISVISLCYAKVRMHSLAKKCTEELMGERVRKKLSKLILFKHQ